ncbi:Mitochondrial import inner membrane translocase subunit tim-10 isoform 1 [Quillaja saponaria]|uniref:Mitochondrial import inner membrane translocase subunit tim-10 isoform 1 n=1 Tax=Quillaja saponaria TaxID=32244 RepID=A0AAD7LQS9_QUISA|nr:Mitochondrial import inner membrane translocase subunit tim-10 isoform 1 [Quillaja saponaria]
MLIYYPSPMVYYGCSISMQYFGGINSNRNRSSSSSCSITNRASRSFSLAIGGLLSAAVVIAASVTAVDAIQESQLPGTLSNIPQTLSGDCPSVKDCKKAKIQRPKSRKAESCTVKCVTTCIRGGEGSPGEGPLNIRRPLVVFKQGFRSRQYCLVECSDICNLIGDGEDGS